MKIDIIEFYPYSKQKPGQLSGTLHIFVCAKEHHLRGIKVIQKKGRWYFYLPHLWELDETTGKKVFFPVSSYTSMRENKELIEAIHREGPKYIQAKLRP